MITFIVRMRFDPNEHEQIRTILTDLATASRQEPGCVTYIPHLVAGEAATVLIYEQYRDEQAVEFHRSTPHFRQYAIGGLYQRMLDRKVENLSAIL